MSRADEFMMTAEEIRAQQRKRRRIFIASAAVVILLVAAFFGGRPTFNAIKAWQARRHAANAFDYIEHQNWVEARKEATSAYQLYPSEPQSLRAVARFLSRTRQPDALEFWQQLEKVAPLNREDLQDEASVALALGESDRAQAAVQALINSKSIDPASSLLAAQLSIQKGAAEDATSALRKIFDDPRATEGQQLQAALLELSLASSVPMNSEGLETAATDERAADAWSRIEKISRGKSVTARDALVLLARRELASKTVEAGVSPATAEPNAAGTAATTTNDLAQRLRDHPQAKAPQKLLAFDLDEHANPSRRDELIRKGIAQFKNGDADDLLALATWLNGKAEFQKTLDTIPLEKALQSRDLFLQYLDALGGLDRWSEVKQILESDRFPLDPVVHDMYLARCNAQLGEKTAAENNWQRALEAAAGDPGKLLSLGEYAEKNGIIDVAKSAFDNAAQQSPKLRVAQQGRLRIAQRSGDTAKIHAVLADMLKIWPDDAAVQNDEGYTRLLLQSRGRSETEDSRSGQSSPTPSSQLPSRARDELAAGIGVEAGVSPATEKQAAGTAATTATDQKSPSTFNSQPSATPSSQLPSAATDEIAALERLAASLVEKNPRSLPHRTFLALARLKQNRPADALAVYDNVKVAPGALTPSALAVHAAVLAANGRTEEAKAEAGQIKLDALLPEERKLLAGLSQQ